MLAFRFLCIFFYLPSVYYLLEKLLFKSLLFLFSKAVIIVIRVSFGSSKGSMVETLIYESPLQEEPETSPPPKPQETTFPYTVAEDEYVYIQHNNDHTLTPHVFYLFAEWNYVFIISRHIFQACLKRLNLNIYVPTYEPIVTCCHWLSREFFEIFYYLFYFTDFDFCPH